MMLNCYSHDKRSSREEMTSVAAACSSGRQELCWAHISWSQHYHKPSSFKRKKYLHDWPFPIASPSPTTFMDLVK